VSWKVSSVPATDQDTVVIVHVVGPWELGYHEGLQRWEQRCLRCDRLLGDANVGSRATLTTPAGGWPLGQKVALTEPGGRWYQLVSGRDLLDGEQACTYRRP
jgi:hypothetical protein